MAEYIVMPKLGFDMREAELVSWLKEEGEPVEGEIVAEIELIRPRWLEAQAGGIPLKKLEALPLFQLTSLSSARKAIRGGGRRRGGCLPASAERGPWSGGGNCARCWRRQRRRRRLPRNGSSSRPVAARRSATIPGRRVANPPRAASPGNMA